MRYVSFVVAIATLAVVGCADQYYPGSGYWQLSVPLRLRIDGRLLQLRRSALGSRAYDYAALVDCPRWVHELPRRGPPARRMAACGLLNSPGATRAIASTMRDSTATGPRRETHVHRVPVRRVIQRADQLHGNGFGLAGHGRKSDSQIAAVLADDANSSVFRNGSSRALTYNLHCSIIQRWRNQ